MSNELTELVTTENQNIVQTALVAGRGLAPKVITNPILDGVPFVVLRDGDGNEREVYLKERLDKPPRTIASIKLNDAKSFIAYWKKHHSPASATLYAQASPATFIAIFDDNGNLGANYRQHRAVYKVEHSLEFKSWTGRHAQPFDSNEKFALWIEDQLPDIVRPDGSHMLEMALNFRVAQNASFGNAVRLSDGNTQFAYTNNVEGSSQIGQESIKIPNTFDLSIPIFQGLEAKKYNIEARFRYRLNANKLAIHYELVRPHKVVEQAFKDLLNEITSATGTEVLFGSPE